MSAQIKAREAREKAAQERAKADIREWEAKQQPRPWQRELTRCIASGRSQSLCLSESIEKEAGDLLPGLKKVAVPAGLYLTGAFVGQGGLNIAFHPDGA